MEKLQILETVLGVSQKANRDYYQFYCPFCGHPKKKLGVSLGTGQWKCWVCPSKGSNVTQLFLKLRVSDDLILKVKAHWKERIYLIPNEPTGVQLPREFTPLYDQSGSFFYFKAKAYLEERGITENDLIKHQIGYCESGSYGGMVIFPYYNPTNQLQHFFARTYCGHWMKFKEPPNTSKNQVFDDNLINWHEPVVIVESKFDAIAVKRNAIPLNGKKITTKLKQKILDEQTPKIIFCLDGDALADAITQAEYFLNSGIVVWVAKLPPTEDPNSLGYDEIWKYIHESKPLTISDIHKFKMFNVIPT